MFREMMRKVWGSRRMFAAKKNLLRVFAPVSLAFLLNLPFAFLVSEYPAHKYCQEDLLRIAKLQRDQLAEIPQAQKTYEEFLKRFPRSPRKREVEESLAELALLQNSADNGAKNSASENSGSTKT